MFLLALPDTLLPLFGIPSYPSSGIGVTIAFIGTIFWTTKENTFHISKSNIIDAIYNEANIAIIALDDAGNMDSCNGYAKNMLAIDESRDCKLSDLLEANEQQLSRIMEGKKLSEHLMSKKTGISCSVCSAVSRDTYGDSYGVVVMITDAIINKTDRLTDEEFAEIKKHPVIGGEILSGISEMPDIEVGARWHHEKYDGTGYPDCLSGEDISEVAR